HAHCDVRRRYGVIRARAAGDRRLRREARPLRPRGRRPRAQIGEQCLARGARVGHRRRTRRARQSRRVAGDRARRDQRIERTQQHVAEPVSRTRAHTHVPAHVPPGAARQGCRHRGRRGARTESAVAAAPTHERALSRGAQPVRRRGRSRGSRPRDRAMGRRGDLVTNASLTADARVQTTDAIRQHFPALERREGGRWVAYFDGPGGTQVPREVADAVTGYLLHHNANTHWAYPTSIETDAAIARARRTIADFLNARDDEIAFGQNMTSLTFHLARGIGRRLGVGDEIVVTELDHHANIAPWQALATERGVTVRMVRMHPETGQLDWEDLERSIGNRTRVVALGAASN